MRGYKKDSQIRKYIVHQGITASSPATIYTVPSGKKLYISSIFIDFQNNLPTDSVCNISDGSTIIVPFLVESGSKFTHFLDYSGEEIEFSDYVVAKTLSGSGGVACSISFIGYEE